MQIIFLSDTSMLDADTFLRAENAWYDMMKFWYKEEAVHVFSDEVDFPVYSDDLSLWTKMYCKQDKFFVIP